MQSPESFDRILDLIGPAAIIDTFKHINKQGIICITGLLGNKWSFEFEPLEELPNSTYLTIADSGDRNQEDVNALFSYIEKYHVNVKPQKVFSLDNIQEAHRYLESPTSFGKVVVCPFL